MVTINCKSDMQETNYLIIEIYCELWKIVESFRVTKNDLDARPE